MVSTGATGVAPPSDRNVKGAHQAHHERVLRFSHRRSHNLSRVTTLTHGRASLNLCGHHPQYKCDILQANLAKTLMKRLPLEVFFSLFFLVSVFSVYSD
jgi:hypothetical protein